MVHNIKTAAALTAAFASTALAHFHLTGIVADDVYYGGYSLQYYYEDVNTGTFTESVGWYAENLDNGFITPDAYNTSNIVCHKNGQPANLTATVAAGGTVEFQWTDVGHIGPVLTYVALCDGECTDPALDKTALEWVKIDEAGYDVSTETWATTTLNTNNNSWTVTVPSDLIAGNYVFRHEIIAVHAAGSLDGAQNYPQCVNIAITGSGTTSPAGTVATALYSETDPGIYFNPYTTITEYTIPGPALMAGGVDQTDGTGAVASGSASTAVVAPSTVASSSVATSSTVATSAVSLSSASAAVAAVVPTTLVTKASSAQATATSAPMEEDDSCDA